MAGIFLLSLFIAVLFVVVLVVVAALFVVRCSFSIFIFDSIRGLSYTAYYILYDRNAHYRRGSSVCLCKSNVISFSYTNTQTVSNTGNWTISLDFE